MKENIRLLIELQGIDSVILRDKNIVDSMPSKLLSADNSIKIIQANFDKQKQRTDLLEKKKREKEKAIGEVNEKINKLKTRTSEIKTNKEYQAHLKEIESAEKERYAVEDEILNIMEEIDTTLGELKAEEIRSKAEKHKIEAQKKEIENEIAEAEKELAEKKAKRADLAKRIDPDVYNDYMSVLAITAGLAVVEVKNEICQGCNMNIPPQMYVEIKENKEMIKCPQCRRILYWKGKDE